METPFENFPPHAAINTKLAEIVKNASTVPPWYDDWMLLGPKSSPTERLKVYQAVHRVGSLPEEASLYLVAWQIDAITSERGETKLREWEDRLDDLQTEGEEELDEEAPAASPEYDQALKEFHAAWDELFLRTLREFGEIEIAELFKNDRVRFEQFHEAGRQYFHGPTVPDWLNDSLEAIAGCIEVADPVGPLGFRWQEESGFWEIDIYPMPVELVGGAIVDPGYSRDMTAMQKEFEHIDNLSWNTHGYHGSDPPFVSIEGTYQGQEIFVRVLSAAPEGEEPSMKFQVTR